MNRKMAVAELAEESVGSRAGNEGPTASTGPMRKKTRLFRAYSTQPHNDEDTGETKPWECRWFAYKRQTPLAPMSDLFEDFAGISTDNRWWRGYETAVNELFSEHEINTLGMTVWQNWHQEITIFEEIVPMPTEHCRVSTNTELLEQMARRMGEGDSVHVVLPAEPHGFPCDVIGWIRNLDYEERAAGVTLPPPPGTIPVRWELPEGCSDGGVSFSPGWADRIRPVPRTVGICVWNDHATLARASDRPGGHLYRLTQEDAERFFALPDDERRIREYVRCDDEFREYGALWDIWEMT